MLVKAAAAFVVNLFVKSVQGSRRRRSTFRDARSRFDIGVP
jgi:hypothetical protein